MGKAAASFPRRTYLITDHVVDQLRRRYTLDGIGHRRDSDLKNLIDTAVVDAVRSGEDTYIFDEGEPAQIVRLQKSLNDDLWAFVKKNSDRDHPEFIEAVITLLKNDQVERSMESGKFTENDGSDDDITPEAVTDSPTPVEACFVHYSTKAGGPQLPEEYLSSEAALSRMDELSNQQKIVPGTVRLSKELKTRRHFVLQED